MNLKNTGNKIISVGETLILPGKTETVPDSYKDNPIVQLYVKKGMLAALKESGTKAASEPKQSDDKPVAKMSKDELVAKCKALGLEVTDEDTKATLIEKITAEMNTAQ